MKRFLYSIALLGALLPAIASAQTFPIDATSTYLDVNGNGLYTLLATSTKTILHLTLSRASSGSNAVLTVYCGTPLNSTNLITDNQLNNVFQVPMEKNCNSALYLTVSSNDNTNGEGIFVTYVPRNRNLTPDPYVYTVASSTASVAGYTGVTATDWLFVAGIIIFILSYMLWPRLLRPIPKLYE